MSVKFYRRWNYLHISFVCICNYQQSFTNYRYNFMSVNCFIFVIIIIKAYSCYKWGWLYEYSFSKSHEKKKKKEEKEEKRRREKKNKKNKKNSWCPNIFNILPLCLHVCLHPHFPLPYQSKIYWTGVVFSLLYTWPNYIRYLYLILSSIRSIPEIAPNPFIINFILACHLRYIMSSSSPNIRSIKQ